MGVEVHSWSMVRRLETLEMLETRRLGWERRTMTWMMTMRALVEMEESEEW